MVTLSFSRVKSPVRKELDTDIGANKGVDLCSVVDAQPGEDLGHVMFHLFDGYRSRAAAS
jgi:hypothetical protein